MTEPIIARITLRKARLFLELTKRLKPYELDEFSALLEAAIVFGRAVTNHIQKEFRHRSGFDEWYAEHQERLQIDALAKFMYKTRTFILKQGQLPVTRVISVSGIEAVAVGKPSVILRVIRSTPWYRRNPSITLQDLHRHLANRLQSWRAGRQNQQDHHVIRPQSVRMTQTWHFDDSTWKDRPSVELIREYLNKLEPIVAEAEQIFGEKL